MWLIHVGFMSYEAGAASPQERDVDGDEEHPHDRRRDADVLLLRLVDLRLLQHRDHPVLARRLPDSAGEALPGTSSSEALMANFCSTTYPWAANFGPEPPTTSRGVFLLAFLLFSWTTASIMSGRAHRARAALGLPHPRFLLGSVVWIMDAAWGWSAGGWLADALRIPRLDRLARRPRRRGRLHARRPPQPRPADRQIRHGTGRARTFRAHNTASDSHGADAHLHRLLRLLRRLPRHPVDHLARLAATSTSSPTTLGAIAFVITIGFAGGFTGGYFASKGDPFWTLVRGSGRRDLGLGRSRRLPPVARLSALMFGGSARRVGRQLDREASFGSTTRSELSRFTASAASTACSSSGYSRPATRPG